MTRSIETALTEKQNGFVRHNSLFLPFHFELISGWIGKDMSLIARPDHIVDFTGSKSEVGMREGESYTNLVFRNHKDLKKELGHYKGHVVLTVTEKDADIFDSGNRHFLKISFHDDTDEVFTERVDDPFKL